MKNIAIVSIACMIVLSSCVSKKKFTSMTKLKNDCETELINTRTDLDKCNDENNEAQARLKTLEESNKLLKDQVNNLNKTNGALLNNIGDLATLSRKEAENLERSLASIQEKDLQIKSMRDAINKKDSVTLALVTSIKGALGDINDEDIEVSVEKGAVFVSISDKMLFRSGSYQLTGSAKSILGKVATVINDKPNIDFMVEGHTDNVPISIAGIKDNWDLSVLRATMVVRTLQKDFKVSPERMTAAGRSHYIPVADNNTSANRAKNRRTRIVILPRMDQFYNMIEEGMRDAK